MSKKKNVIKLCLILGVTILLTIIICNIYRNYEGGKSNSSYISKYVSTIQYNELSSAVTELSGDTFLYLSYIGDKNIYDLERQIRRQLKINELEDNKRGIYGGAIGYIDFTGNLDTCIAIRIAFKKNGKVFVRSGAGIVADSIPENEYTECINKAKAVMTAIEMSQDDM